MSDPIINKVASSALVSLNLEEYIPKQEVVGFDLKPHLFMEMIVKEKEFRTSLQNVDWSKYSGKVVGVYCSADAIIPMWAYMLVATHLQPMAFDIHMGNEEEALKMAFINNLRKIDPDSFYEKKVVVKGCGDTPIAAYAYLEITRILRPQVKSIMYGEPCSTVPVFKQKI